MAREAESVEGAILRCVEKACRVDATAVLEAKSCIDFGQAPAASDISSFVPASHERHEAPVLATSFRIRFTSDGSGISNLFNELWFISSSRTAPVKDALTLSFGPSDESVAGSIMMRRDHASSASRVFA